ncbi:hypothetical protein EVAR_49902_1 [Eumeta japonica]|uniref:Uncharacterized protein n=1 Tax=Eumeta variegata TaxID=151549 RepID=A0A4C1Y2A3_EUMVA|nr:hypothetical protein EVAR_49902_1 [Eumeta japonica]
MVTAAQSQKSHYSIADLLKRSTPYFSKPLLWKFIENTADAISLRSSTVRGRKLHIKHTVCFDESFKPSAPDVFTNAKSLAAPDLHWAIVENRELYYEVHAHLARYDLLRRVAFRRRPALRSAGAAGAGADTSRRGGTAALDAFYYVPRRALMIQNNWHFKCKR